MKPPGEFIRSGKVKDIYSLRESELLFHFTDRVSAFDVILPTVIPGKGEVLCRLSAHFFQTLGVPHHMIRLEGPNMMTVRKLAMIPVECVVRGYLYGSLFERFSKGELPLPVEKVLATKLPQPYFDPTTKSNVKDEPITGEGIVEEGRMSSQELAQVEEKTVSIYEKIAAAAEKAGFILADLKLEFGRDDAGGILLADSIGPDEFRLWAKDAYKPGKTQESYDKQPIRDWLISVGYRERLENARKAGLKVPPPPELPERLVAETSRRYVQAYEGLTGTKFK